MNRMNCSTAVAAVGAALAANLAEAGPSQAECEAWLALLQSEDDKIRAEAWYGAGPIGAAGNFIDPIWSTGVILATTSARLAARAIGESFRSGTNEALRDYETSVQNLVGRYRHFIYFFYHTNASPTNYFWKAYSIVVGAADPKDAFIRLVSGRFGCEGPAERAITLTGAPDTTTALP